MTRLRTAAIVTELMDQLHNAGSWTGETHIQKATYLLEQLFAVPLEFEFTLYKHGPYSFRLRDELTAMRADQLVTIDPRPPYGPSYVTAPASEDLRTRFPKTLRQVRPLLIFIAEALGSKGVADLEQLSTAMYARVEDPNRNPDQLADRVRELKPHISPAGAAAGVEAMLKLREEAAALMSTSQSLVS